VIEGVATRVMSLRDGTKKMSKSDPSDMSRINLTDDADAIASKIRKARTDPDPLPDHAGPRGAGEARNLVNIYAALAGTDAEKVVADFAGRPFSDFKPALADLAVAHLAPITARMTDLLADPAEIDRLLGVGADKADALATPILARTAEIVGFVRSRAALTFNAL
jgi:tryptophanyl-tRNA synthetase